MRQCKITLKMSPALYQEEEEEEEEGDYVLNWSDTSFPCFMNFKALSCASSFKVHKTWKTIV